MLKVQRKKSRNRQDCEPSPRKVEVSELSLGKVGKAGKAGKVALGNDGEIELSPGKVARSLGESGESHEKLKNRQENVGKAQEIAENSQKQAIFAKIVGNFKRNRQKSRNLSNNSWFFSEKTDFFAKSASFRAKSASFSTFPCKSAAFPEANARLVASFPGKTRESLEKRGISSLFSKKL